MAPAWPGRLWHEHALPILTDLCTRNAAPMRARLLPHARGEVLEIGIGSGPSLPFYGTAVEALVGLEPNARAVRKLARRRAPFPVTPVQGSAQALPFDDERFDTVSVQLVLCSLPDPAGALAEAVRVLKPGGQLLFLEHVRHTDPRVAQLQDRWSPRWSRIFGGCRLNQDADALLHEAGLAVQWRDARIDRARPRFLSHVVWGAAARR